MSWTKALFSAVAISFVACSSGVNDRGTDPDATANLALALVGSDSQGVQYRLRNAEFEIIGYPELVDFSAGGAPDNYYSNTVSTETDPNAAVISQRVLPGIYYVTLASSDWFLEELTPRGAQRVEQAVLLSPRQIGTWVGNGSTSTVHYQFGVDGELIDFRSGDLNIEIGIERPGENGGGGEDQGAHGRDARPPSRQRQLRPAPRTGRSGPRAAWRRWSRRPGRGGRGRTAPAPRHRFSTRRRPAAPDTAA